MGSPASQAGAYNKRREMDVMKLLMSDWKVELVNDSTRELEVDFEGPPGSPYEGGLWKVRVELPDNYPYKSPSIGFKNKIYHPNVDESAGSVCLDVINQTWSPLFELVNVFEVFLPQLLLYPNPKDPLNGDAAALLIREPEVFNAKVRGYVQKYAPNPNKKVVEPPAGSSGAGCSASANAESNSGQERPSPDRDVAGGSDKKQGGDSDSAGDMSGLLSDSDED